jgi:hypothetical protein
MVFLPIICPYRPRRRRSYSRGCRRCSCGGGEYLRTLHHHYYRHRSRSRNLNRNSSPEPRPQYRDESPLRHNWWVDFLLSFARRLLDLPPLLLRQRQRQWEAPFSGTPRENSIGPRTTTGAVPTWRTGDWDRSLGTVI